MEQAEDFKVVDRRHTSPDAPESKGEGFVMKEPEPSTPADVDISTLFLSLATGALINMGLAPDPVTKKAEKNLELAKQNIEILELLKQKTRSNLTPEENQLIENLLTETRLRFVEASKK